MLWNRIIGSVTGRGCALLMTDARSCFTRDALQRGCNSVVHLAVATSICTVYCLFPSTTNGSNNDEWPKSGLLIELKRSPPLPPPASLQHEVHTYMDVNHDSLLSLNGQLLKLLFGSTYVVHACQHYPIACCVVLVGYFHLLHH